MTEKATFAAGCFWGVEAAFRQVPGVTATRVGYTGGHTDNPTYRQVCSHRTGHAEAVEVTFDPERVPYEILLEIFWRKHNPRTQFAQKQSDSTRGQQQGRVPREFLPLHFHSVGLEFFDPEAADLSLGEGLGEAIGELNVCEQRNTEINRFTPDMIIVG